MTTSITNFLTYDNQAEEAAKFYTSLFDGTIKETLRSPPGGPNPEGSVLTVTFQILGQTYIALNGGPEFAFSQAFSIMVQVDTQADSFIIALPGVLDAATVAAARPGGEDAP